MTISNLSQQSGTAGNSLSFYQFEVEVNNGTVTRYPGSYADYVYHMEKEVRRQLTAG